MFLFILSCLAFGDTQVSESEYDGVGWEIAIAVIEMFNIAFQLVYVYRICKTYSMVNDIKEYLINTNDEELLHHRTVRL